MTRATPFCELVKPVTTKAVGVVPVVVVVAVEVVEVVDGSDRRGRRLGLEILEPDVRRQHAREVAEDLLPRDPLGR